MKHSFAVACAIAFLLLSTISGTAFAGHAHHVHLVFFNHSFAVLDADTANAIEHSEYLKTFGVFDVRTTTANGGETWKGRYLAGRQPYLELFGPDDLKDSVVGATGIAISPDRAGGVAAVKAALIHQGIAHPDSARRTRQYGAEQVP